MNAFNRFVLILLLLLSLVAATSICLFPDFYITQISLLSDWLINIKPRILLVDRLILIGAAVILDLVIILLLALEFYRPGAKRVRVQQVDGGTATVSVNSIRQRLGFYIDGLEDVVSVNPKVNVRRNAVSVVAEVKTSAVVDVPSKAREIVDVIRMVVTETMGLKLRDEPRVQIRTGSFRDVPVRPALPQANLPSFPVAAPVVEEE